MGKKKIVTALLTNSAGYNNFFLYYAKGQTKQLQHFPLDFKINDVFVFKSVKSYGGFSSPLLSLARSTGNGFWCPPRLLGGLAGSQKAFLLAWLARLSPTHPQKSLASLLCFCWANEGNPHRCDWFSDRVAKASEAQHQACRPPRHALPVAPSKVTLLF